MENGHFLFLTFAFITTRQTVIRTEEICKKRTNKDPKLMQVVTVVLPFFLRINQKI